jgi:hypothetical protein
MSCTSTQPPDVLATTTVAFECYEASNRCLTDQFRQECSPQHAFVWFAPCRIFRIWEYYSNHTGIKSKVYRCLPALLICLPAKMRLMARPRPSCTPDSSADLQATATVRSLVHEWPFSAIMQPSLRPISTPFSPCHFLCLTFHFSLPCPISNFTPYLPYVSFFLALFLARYGPFAALTLRLNGFHSFIWPDVSALATALFCTFF